MIKRFQFQDLAGTVGEFSSPGSTFCADSCLSVCCTMMLLHNNIGVARDIFMHVFGLPGIFSCLCWG